MGEEIANHPVRYLCLPSTPVCLSKRFGELYRDVTIGQETERVVVPTAMRGEERYWGPPYRWILSNYLVLREECGLIVDIKQVFDANHPRRTDDEFSVEDS